MISNTDSLCFICGSLEPGKDGVGDYTRRLAAAFIKKGIPTIAIAINDRKATHQDIGHTIQVEDEFPITVYRFSSIDALNEVVVVLERHQVTVISLQYVPYSFHDRGLPFGLAAQLVRLRIGVRWHLMCHELWLQDSWGNPKNKILGLLQRRILAKLILAIKPATIHTSINFYRDKLQALGHKAIVRPIHGGFPLATDETWSLRDELTALGMPDACQIVIFFGTIYPHFPIEEFVASLVRHTAKTHSQVAVCTIGRNNYPSSTVLLRETISHAPTSGGFYDIGSLSPQRVRKSFSEANFGVCTTPLENGGKSGSAAAMLESGLSEIGYRSQHAIARGVPPLFRTVDLATHDLPEEVPNQKDKDFNILDETVKSMTVGR